MCGGNMKQFKKYWHFILLVVIFVGMITFLSQNTLSKYRDEFDGLTSVQLARWNIKVNNQVIANQDTLTADITPTFEGTDTIAAGVLAPGAKGYYDIIIDASEVDVAFSYRLTLNRIEDEIISDILLSGYTINPNDNNEIMTYADEIYGEIALDQDTVTIRVYFEWDDSEDATMDNAADTDVIINYTSVPVINNKIEFNQIKK